MSDHAWDLLFSHLPEVATLIITVMGAYWAQRAGSAAKEARQTAEAVRTQVKVSTAVTSAENQQILAKQEVNHAEVKGEIAQVKQAVETAQPPSSVEVNLQTPVGDVQAATRLPGSSGPA